MSAYDTWAEGHMQAMVDYHHGTRMDEQQFRNLFCSEKFRQGYDSTYDHHLAQLGPAEDERQRRMALDDWRAHQ